MYFILQPGTRISGKEIDLVLDQCTPEDPSKGYVPAYVFSIILSSSDRKIGYLNLRMDTNENVEKYAGHIGYGIEEEFRGNHYAAKACNLMKSLLKKHKMEQVWITANPDNKASIKTLHIIGAKYIDTLQVPKDHEIFLQGESMKSRFLWKI